MTRGDVEQRIAENAADVLAFLHRRVGDPDDAADLLGDTLTEAWSCARRMPADPTEARMWLFGIARNMIGRHARTRRRRSALADQLAAALAVSLPRQRWDQLGLSVEVRDAVEGLPPQLAELVRLVHWDGFTIEQAAELTGVPASTARSRHVRAKALLRDALGQSPSPPAPAVLRAVR